ncbi:MAG: CPBP family intramembrane metalloprotease [Anaerolineales bacterium]|nr:CPBP family intramembrane metalloprotease [Anaerolineae bacterium]PWB71558.1 MAG: CPBP family intramembrane metalloprotease [Anaerolineales bacterium]
MSTQEIVSTNKGQDLSTSMENQYTLWQILGIWFAAGAPMWILGWVTYPALSAGLAPLDAGLLRMKLITVGLVWQFVLSMIILYREEGNIRPSTISRRFWLNHPRSARSGETKKALWWWIIPLCLLAAALEFGLRSTLVDVWTGIFPFFAEPAGYDFSVMLTPEMRVQLVGAWGMLALFSVSALFNTFLGEEFLFRGVLLPKMEGVFGKWDWVANGVMFSFYHLHQPWGILATLPADLILAFSGRRFRSNWFPIIIHSGQSVFFLVLILGLVLGLA